MDIRSAYAAKATLKTEGAPIVEDADRREVAELEHDLREAIDSGGGQACDVDGVILAINAAGLAVLRQYDLNHLLRMIEVAAIEKLEAANEIADCQRRLANIAKNPDTPLIIKQYARGDI